MAQRHLANLCAVVTEHLDGIAAPLVDAIVNSPDITGVDAAARAVLDGRLHALADAIREAHR